MPMPPAEVVNSIQTSFDNGRMLTAICIASRETSKGRGISGEALADRASLSMSRSTNLVRKRLQGRPTISAKGQLRWPT
jgi:hypothetical protein